MNVHICEGYRAPAGVRYPPKQEAAGPGCELWVFRILLRLDASATADWARTDRLGHGLELRCPAWMIAGIRV
jgi:hypothetical protein